MIHNSTNLYKALHLKSFTQLHTTLQKLYNTSQYYTKLYTSQQHATQLLQHSTMFNSTKLYKTLHDFFPHKTLIIILISLKKQNFF